MDPIGPLPSSRDKTQLSVLMIDDIVNVTTVFRSKKQKEKGEEDEDDDHLDCGCVCDW